MQPRQLEAFRRVMEFGSVSAAAKRMHVSQPTVSRLLSELERSTGLTLFDRRKGRVHPRQEAISFVEEVEKVFLGENYLRRVAASLRDNVGVRLRVGFFPAFGLHRASKVVAEFRRQYPSVGLSYVIATTPQLVEQVSGGALDVAAVAGPINSPALEIVERFSVECVCALSQNDPLAKAPVVELKKVDAASLIWMEPRSQIALAVRRALRATGAEFRGSLEVNLTETACQLASLGMGRAIIDPFTADNYVLPGLVHRPIKPAVAFDYAIVRSPAYRLSAAGEAFIEKLVAGAGSAIGVKQRTRPRK